MSERFGGPRSSAGNLSYAEGGGREGGGRGGGGQRWDPERFTRERERAERFGRQAVVERERVETERFGRPAGGFSAAGRPRRESSADESVSYTYGGGRGGRGGRFEEKDRYIVEEKFRAPPRRAPAFFDEEERPPPRRVPAFLEEEEERFESSPTRSMVPFSKSRRQSITVEKERESPARRGPARPGLLRRQSSLDTFDRKPLPRYADHREIIREKEIVPIPLPRRERIERRSPPRRYEEPPRPRYEERDFEEIRVAEPEYYGDEEFRGFRERDIIRERQRSTSRFKYGEPYEEEEVVEEEIFEEPEFPKKGKTRMPKRLVKTAAIMRIGYPFEEEEETIVILKALGKEQIDEVISLSKEMKETGGESRTTYLIEAPPPPEPQIIQIPAPTPQPQYIQVPAPPPPPPELVERRTEIVMSPPPPPEIPASVRNWDMMSHHTERRESSPSGHESHHSTHRSEHESRRGSRSEHESRHGSRSERGRSEHGGKSEHGSVHESRHSTRRASSTKREYIERDESDSIAGPLSLIMPERRAPKSEQAIKAEIRALEAEKKALKYEREVEKEQRKAQRFREVEYVETREPEGVVEIKKDRKGRLSMVRS
ncbi:MAG: hypothetical protein M1827_003973 [Pycnora praestabilis]|nr:MAG: hypothetical protein M1827_003973 [Pycnora praestabilis]